MYEQRNTLMASDDISETVEIARDEVVDELISAGIPPQSLEEQWDIPAVKQELSNNFGIDLPIEEWLAQDDSLHEETLRSRIRDEIVGPTTAKWKMSVSRSCATLKRR